MVMKSHVLLALAGVALLSSGGGYLLWADGAAPAADGTLIDLTKDSSTGEMAFDGGATATIDSQASVIKINFPAGQGYPGIRVSDPNGAWNLTGYTGVEAEITNTGSSPVKVALRVDGGDNWQDSPWDCESASIPPGETKTIHVTFGQSYGNAGYKVSADHVLRALIFAVDPDSVMTVSVKSIKAVK